MFTLPRRLSAAKARLVLLVIVALSGVAAVAATSAFGSASGRSQRRTAVVPKSSHSANSLPNLKYVAKQIAKYQKLPHFTAPGPPFDASQLKGETMYEIPDTDTIPWVVMIEQQMQKIAKRYGIKLVVNHNQGQVSQWVQAMNIGVAKHPKIINLFGPTVSSLRPQIAAAQRAHIPVVMSHESDRTTPKPKYVDAQMPAAYSIAARLEADWVTQQTKGKADVLIVNSADYPPSDGIVATIQKEFKARCGSGCKTTVTNVSIAKWGTDMQPAVQSALLRDPSINYMIPIYDGMMQFVAPAIQTAGRLGKVHVATYNATPFVLKMLRSGQIVTFDVGESLAVANGIMDVNMRIMAGLKAPLIEPYGLRIFTKANVGQTGNPPVATKGYGSEEQQGYAKLWSGKK